MSVTTLQFRFKLLGPRAPTVLRLSFDFKLSPPPPNIFLWNDGWVATTQRVWTGEGWSPGL